MDAIKSISSNEVVRTNTLLKARPDMWVKGDVGDIKLGDYFVHYEWINRKDYQERKLCDHLVNEGPRETIGWIKGLEKNIHVRAGDTDILVMDNHNYAAVFIIDMFHKDNIAHMAKMVHIDRHHDFAWAGETFDVKAYANLRKAKDRHRYLLNYTDIANWQHNPLFKDKFVDINKWHWIVMDNFGKSWVETDPVSHVDFRSFRKLSGLGFVEKADILDIDLDVFTLLDRNLSDMDRYHLMTGKIPPIAVPLFLDLVNAAKRKKVITIATSPGYMDQKQAVVYARNLVSGILEAKNG
jgi:hypothetical protein